MHETQSSITVWIVDTVVLRLHILSPFVVTYILLVFVNCMHFVLLESLSMCKCMSVVLIFKICPLGVWVVKGKDCVGSGECLNTVIFNLFIVTFLPVCLLISDMITCLPFWV